MAINGEEMEIVGEHTSSQQPAFGQQVSQEKPVETQQSTQSRVDMRTTNPTIEAVDFKTLAMRSAPQRSLPADGERYLHLVQERLEKCDIKCTRLNTINGVIFHSGGIGIACMFVDQFDMSSEFIPITRYNSKVADDAKNIINGVYIVDYFYVTSHDYAFPEKLFDAVRSIMETLRSPITLGSMGAQDYRYNNNFSRVKDVLDALSPSGIPEHVQFGSCLEMCTTQILDKSGFRSFENRKRDDEQSWVPIISVGAYTDFVENMTYTDAGRNFTPLVHVSANNTTIKSPVLTLVMLCMAYQNFIVNGMWSSHFKVALNQHPNIGSLVIDPETKSPVPITDYADQRKFIDRACGKPILVVDTIEGRLDSPGVNMLSNKKGNETLISLFSEFIGTSRPMSDIDRITRSVMEQYTGIIRTEGEYIDSRSVDYFKLIEKQLMDRDIRDTFLQYSVRPEARLAMLARIGYGEVRSLYTNRICIIEPKALKYITDCVSGVFKPLSDAAKDSNWDVSNFASLGDEFANLFDGYRDVFQSAGGYTRDTFDRSGVFGDVYRNVYRGNR